MEKAQQKLDFFDSLSPHLLVRVFFMSGTVGIEPIQCKCPVGICRPPAGRRVLLNEIDSRTLHHEK